MSGYIVKQFYSSADDITKYEVKRVGEYGESRVGYTLTREEADALIALDSRPKCEKKTLSREEYYRQGGAKGTYYGDDW